MGEWMLGRMGGKRGKGLEAGGGVGAVYVRSVRGDVDRELVGAWS